MLGNWPAPGYSGSCVRKARRPTAGAPVPQASNNGGFRVAYGKRVRTRANSAAPPARAQWRCFRLRGSSSVANPARRAAYFDHLLLLVGYVLLDWASYIHPLYGLNITPWSPAPALGVFFLARHGGRAAPTLWLAILAADVWVRQLPASLPATAVLAAVLMLGYWGIAELLLRRVGGVVFADRRGMLAWGAIIALGTLLNSALFVSLLALVGLIPEGGWPAAALRYWVGDAVGLLVAMPALWMLLDAGGRAQLAAAIRSRTAIGYLAAIPPCLWVAFGLGAEAEFKYFYVLFLPLAWAAATQGLAGAMLAAALLQVGIILGVEWLGYSAISVVEVQVLAAVLALSGFFLGVIVDEKERLSQELRQTLRLAAAGEMAGALAHELNQPLTALTAYGAACEALLAGGDPARLRDVVGRMVAESARAAEVLRRLRDFFRTGATQLERVALDALLAPVVAAFAGKAASAGVDFVADAGGGCALLADRLQLEVVLRNLLANAFDAVEAQPAGRRRVALRVAVADDAVTVSVEDSGPGLSEAQVARLFEAFQSSKSRGLGLGLVISRAIVDSHGGRLWAEAGPGGVFRLQLPVEGEANEA